MALEIRVLVVEDDPETRMLTEALLSGRKGVCLCALAKDGLEGLELVEQTRPDIVLLDLILPGMDGLDFLRALRRRSARPAVVVASQASEPTVIRLAFQLGASYYLIKPLNFDSLPDLFHSLCLEPRERAAADYLRGMGASGLGVGPPRGRRPCSPRARRGPFRSRRGMPPPWRPKTPATPAWRKTSAPWWASSRPGPAGSIRPSWAAFRPNGPATSSFSAGWPGGFWSGSATFPLKSDRHSAIL